MRKGTLLGLRWRDIGTTRGARSVRQTVGTRRGAIEIKPPKTASNRREVNIVRDVLDALREHRVRQNERRLE